MVKKGLRMEYATKVIKESEEYDRKMNRRIAKISKKVMLTNSEGKYIDKTANPSMTSTWASAVLCDPVQGDADAGERIGDSLIQRRLEFNASINAADATQVVRVMIVRWLSSQTFVASYCVSDNSTVYAPLAVYSHDQRRNFHVLYDSGPRVLAVGTNGKPNLKLTAKLNLKNYKQQFSGATTTNIKGQMYILYCSDSTAAADPAIIYRIRTHYKDP